MSEVQTAVTTATKVSSRARPVQQRQARSAVHQCLVVTPSAHRAEVLERAAGEQGWETIITEDAENAAREAVRNRIALAVIDLQSVQSEEQAVYRELVEQLATRAGDGPLLIVCGAEEDPAGEIWARQLGVWMYLPGVNSQTDIAMLCGEARSAVEQLHAEK